MINWREEWQKHQFVIPKSFYGKWWKQGIQSASGYRVLQCTTKYWVYWTFSKNAKKSFVTPLGLVRQYNSSKPYCSPSIIIQGNFHLSKHPRERFDRFFLLYKKIYHSFINYMVRATKITILLSCWQAHPEKLSGFLKMLIFQWETKTFLSCKPILNG